MKNNFKLLVILMFVSLFINGCGKSDDKSTLKTNKDAEKTNKNTDNKKSIKGYEDKNGLRRAISKNKPEIIKLIIKNGKDINAKEHSLTAIEYAIKYAKPEIVRLLIEKGANTSIVDSKDNLLFRTRNPKILEILIQKGKLDANSKSYRGEPLLFWYIGSNRIDCVKVLIKNGVDIDVTYNKQVALQYALERKRYALVRLLIEKGADIDVRHNGDDTLLHLTLDLKKDALVRLLIEKGAGCKNFTALRCLVDKDSPNAKFLIKKHLNLNRLAGYQGVNGKITFLMYAALSEKTDIVKLLIEKGANVNIKATNGHTALYYAVEFNATEIVKLLLDKKAKILSPNLLLTAIKNGNKKIVEYLINNGAKAFLNKKYEAGKITPLGFALNSYNINYELIEYIVLKGGDVNAKNVVGFTPLDFISEKKFMDQTVKKKIIALLKKHGAKRNKKMVGGHVVPVSYTTIR